MIQNDSLTMITLGKGTVSIENARLNNRAKPYGIRFIQEVNLKNEMVVINLPNDQAVAEYIAAILNFLETKATSKTTPPRFIETMNKINKNTMITLGKGEVNITNASFNEMVKPYGIQFTQEVNSKQETVVIYLPNDQAVAEYIAAVLNFLKANTSKKTTLRFLETMNKLIKKLEAFRETTNK